MGMLSGPWSTGVVWKEGSLFNGLANGVNNTTKRVNNTTERVNDTTVITNSTLNTNGTVSTNDSSDTNNTTMSTDGLVKEVANESANSANQVVNESTSAGASKHVAVTTGARVKPFANRTV